MKLHEYQSKELFRQYGIDVPPGEVADTVEQATDIATRLDAGLYVVKAQILAGGRGKAGGVKLARSVDEVTSIAANLIGAELKTYQSGDKGIPVHKVLVTTGVDIEKEFYFGMVLDRARGAVTAMASSEGGVEIEEVARKTPEKIVKASFLPDRGLTRFQAMKLGVALGLQGDTLKQAITMFMAAAKLFVEQDASLVEINPLVLMPDGNLSAVDAKVNIDDNALFRHQELADIRDTSEDDPNETEAAKFGLNYIKLDGTIGCMVNGAGLAMATMDTIKLYGAEPANFLDVGGGATVENVSAAFRILMGDPDVKAILVNIFGGIMRCDVIAEGIVEASRRIDISVPLVVRLSGTNVDEGKKILAASGIAMTPADTIAEAARAVVDAVQKA